MRWPVALIVLMLPFLLLTGCASWAIATAPDNPVRPWTPATSADGEILAGQQASPEQPTSSTYVLPSNRKLANIPSPISELERPHVYSLPELIGIAQSNNPVTRNAWNDARNAALAAGIAESTFLPRVSASIIGGYLIGRNNNSVLGQTLTSNVNARGTVYRS